MKTLIVSVPILFLLLSSLSAQQGLQAMECNTDSLVINTGWDHAADTTEIWHDFDSRWRLVRMDIDPQPTSIETGQGSIVPFRCMVPLGDSRWINGSRELQETPQGTWIYERVVCVESVPEEITLFCELLANSETLISFNGVELGRTERNGADHVRPLYLEADLTPYVRGGKNTLQVEVRSFEGSFAGFDLLGSVVATQRNGSQGISCDGCGEVVPDQEKW